MSIIQLLAAVNISPGDLDIPQSSLTENSTKSVLQMVWAVFGGVALIILVLAAIQYIISQGDPQKTAKAKNTIMYALIGLVISILAFSIVTFVIDKL